MPMNAAVLKDQVIVVVGGTTGLGLAGAKACAAAGAKMVVVGRSQENADSAISDLGDDVARALIGDASQPATAERAVQTALDAFGRFDGLYHVAGGSGRSFGDGPLDQITDEGWDITLQRNLTCLFYSNRAAVQQFLRQKSGGAVLNMGSVLGYSPSPRFFATHAYSAAKSAIIGLTKSAASYYASQQIRFNVVAPALVDTPMATRATRDQHIMQYIETKQPLDGGRVGMPEDLDSAVVFFLSPQSHFVTGQVLAVDGGWTVSEGRSPM